MEVFGVVFLILFVLALVVVGRRAWRVFHDGEEPVAAGSFGQQFFGRRQRPEKPEDWVNH